MSTVLSIDLAYKSACDLGICLIERTRRRRLRVSFPHFWKLGIENPPSPKQLAHAIHRFCRDNGILIVFLDGPQGWKDPKSGLKHSRICERKLNAPAKTGAVGQVKPRNYLPFVRFSISTFAELVKLGAKLTRKPTVIIPKNRLLVLESLPLSAWRKLKIAPLPAKRRAQLVDLKDRLRKLQRFYRFHVHYQPGHDQLQALVSGLAGVAILAGNTSGYIAEGAPPENQTGVIVEGFIVNPCR